MEELYTFLDGELTDDEFEIATESWDRIAGSERVVDVLDGMIEAGLVDEEALDACVRRHLIDRSATPAATSAACSREASPRHGTRVASGSAAPPRPSPTWAAAARAG